MSAKLDPELFPESGTRLFEDFGPLDRKSWEERILKDLKSPPDPEKALGKLDWKTAEGFTLKPFYLENEKPGGLDRHLPGEYPYLRGIHGSANQWLVEQTVDLNLHHSSSELDQLLEEFYKHELGSVRILVNDLAHAETGLEFARKIDLTRLKANIDISIPLKDCSGFLDWAFSQDPSTVLVSCDPLARFLRAGAVETSSMETELSGDLDVAAELLKRSGRPILCVGAHLFRYAGANDRTLLSLALSAASYYLEQMLERGLNLETALRGLHMRSAVSSSFFLEIAQLRSARFLWSQIAAAFADAVSGAGGETGDWKAAAALRQSTETSIFELSGLDPYTNLLRATTQSISAVLGGSERHTVHPFHLVTDREDTFSRRMARNIQNLIRHESYLQQVADPGGGSYYLENLTEDLAAVAFEDFQKWEARGGFLKSLQSGEIQKSLEEQLDESLKKIESRRAVYVGVNQYPSLKEEVSEKRFDPYLSHWFEGAAKHTDAFKGKSVAPLRFARATQGFEDLRIHFQSVSRSKGFRPEILLIPAGKLAMQRARAAFSQNFLGCAGFSVEDPGSLGDAKGAAEYLKERLAKSNHIVALTLCSSDEEYAELAESIMPAAKEKGLPVIVAGSPENREELTGKGILEFIHLKSNVFETLVELQKRILGSSVG
ncbi:MAG: hypothetical protein KDK23_16205 [Leptospiraceae bacterium]|nr:hypothetical protein [Leptospiraceae bacterium]